jgi:hypothetical protein
MESEMPLGEQLAEVLLQCVSTRAGEFHDVADSHSAVFTRVVDDPQ